MPQLRTLDDLDVKGKRVLVRADLNVPMKNGKVADASRIERQAPTIRELSDKGARVIGGAKVSTEIALLENLVRKVDILVTGGAMADTFLAAEGGNVGKWMYEEDHLGTARDNFTAAADAGAVILLPTNAVLARELKP